MRADEQYTLIPKSCMAVSQEVYAQGGQQQDSHELLGKLIEGLLAEEVRATKTLQQAVSPAFGCCCDSDMPGPHQCLDSKVVQARRLQHNALNSHLPSIHNKDAGEQSLEPKI